MSSPPRVLEPAQVHDLLAAIPRHRWIGQRDYALTATIWQLGLRIQEACSLRRDDLHPDYIRVFGKGSKTRVVPRTATINDVLSWWMLSALPSSPYLFHTRTGGPVDQRSYRRRLARYAQAAGLPHVWPHLLRHTRATELLQDHNLELHEVRDILGHANLSTTSVYLHTRPRQLIEKMRNL